MAASSAVSNVPNHFLIARRGSRISAAHFPHGRRRTPLYLFFFFALDLFLDSPFPCADSSKKLQPRQPSTRHSLQLSARGEEIAGAESSGLPERTWMREFTRMEFSCSAEKRRLEKWSSEKLGPEKWRQESVCDLYGGGVCDLRRWKRGSPARAWPPAENSMSIQIAPNLGGHILSNSTTYPEAWVEEHLKSPLKRAKGARASAGAAVHASKGVNRLFADWERRRRTESRWRRVEQRRRRVLVGDRSQRKPGRMACLRLPRECREMCERTLESPDPSRANGESNRSLMFLAVCEMAREAEGGGSCELGGATGLGRFCDLGSRRVTGETVCANAGNGAEPGRGFLDGRRRAHCSFLANGKEKRPTGSGEPGRFLAVSEWEGGVREWEPGPAVRIGVERRLFLRIRREGVQRFVRFSPTGRSATIWGSFAIGFTLGWCREGRSPTLADDHDERMPKCGDSHLTSEDQKVIWKGSLRWCREGRSPTLADDHDERMPKCGDSHLTSEDRKVIWKGSLRWCREGRSPTLADDHEERMPKCGDSHLTSEDRKVIWKGSLSVELSLAQRLPQLQHPVFQHLQLVSLGMTFLKPSLLCERLSAHSWTIALTIFLMCTSFSSEGLTAVFLLAAGVERAIILASSSPSAVERGLNLLPLSPARAWPSAENSMSIQIAPNLGGHILSNSTTYPEAWVEEHLKSPLKRAKGARASAGAAVHASKGVNGLFADWERRRRTESRWRRVKLRRRRVLVGDRSQRKPGRMACLRLPRECREMCERTLESPDPSRANGESNRSLMFLAVCEMAREAEGGVSCELGGATGLGRFCDLGSRVLGRFRECRE
ncbi:hypothetical protein M5K25_020181 [Dendrobium thyrsiflorum]|uniref:Uncharacterized protein n=1 Tax=Dendrobium thyrsiflorum TaxID=117978 RepID=A0ABD0U9D5_DENTH